MLDKDVIFLICILVEIGCLDVLLNKQPMTAFCKPQINFIGLRFMNMYVLK